MNRDQFNLHNLRQTYAKGQLLESDLESSPFDQFKKWFEEATEAEINEPNTMTLATATAKGKPTARTVLLKEMDATGFVFYTNYSSRKGQEIAVNPQATLLFYWAPLERQVRIEGHIEKVDAATSDEYFNNRPKGSRIGAIASPQSQHISTRDVLESKVTALEEQYRNEDTIPRPDHWGGYRLVPSYVEFWQGRQNRLHDRLVYQLQDDGNWQVHRLAP